MIIAIITLAACSSDKAKDANGKEGSGKTTTIKLAHVVSQDSTNHKAYVKFKELVEERSDGRIAVEIYPDGQLGGERELVENVQAGNIQIAAPAVGVLANFSSSLNVFDFPFIFKDTESAYEVLDGDVGQELLAGLEESGILGLSYSENGWRHITNGKGEIVKPEDVKGLKLRTMEVPMHIAFWKELGANPTPLAFTEVFTGLSQGVIDAQENPLQLIYTGKFYEANKYITTTGHIYDPDIMITNKDFFEGLSDEDQEIIQTSIDEAIDYLRDLNSDLDNELREKLEAEGAIITDLSAEEREAWVDALIPFYKQHADEVDKEMLIKVLEAAGNEKALEAIK